MIFLPKDPGTHPTRSIHNGKHTNKAMEAVADRMTAVMARGRRQGWIQTQYRAALRKVVSEIRQELKRGDVALNARHRPWVQSP